MKDFLFFLVDLKPILSYASEVSYCEVDFHNIHWKLHQISIEVKTALEQEVI